MTNFKSGNSCLLRAKNFERGFFVQKFFYTKSLCSGLQVKYPPATWDELFCEDNNVQRALMFKVCGLFTHTHDEVRDVLRESVDRA